MTDTSKEVIARYVTRCTEMAEGGEYSWWSGLASLISALEAERDALHRERTNLIETKRQQLAKVGEMHEAQVRRAEAAEALNATLRETTNEPT